MPRGPLTRSCPNRSGLAGSCVDFGGLRVRDNCSRRLKTSGTTPVCRLGEIALITRRSQVQILPPQPIPLAPSALTGGAFVFVLCPVNPMVAIRAGGRISRLLPSLGRPLREVSRAGCLDFVQILSKKFTTKHLYLTKCLVRGYHPVGEGIGSEAQNPDPRAQWPNLLLMIMPGPRWRSAASLSPICDMHSSTRNRADCGRTPAGTWSDEITIVTC